MTLKQFANKHSVKISNEYADSNPNMENSKSMNHYKTTLKMKGKQFTLIFSQGYGIHEEPTAESVLTCLALDASGIDNSRSFEDWANEYGYDTDSRKAEKTYNACIRQTEKLKKFVGDLYDELMGCEE